MKKFYWGPKLCNGLPPVLKEFVEIITKMEANATPQYEKLIELMRTRQTPEGPKRLNDEDIMVVNWNNILNNNDGKYFNKDIVDFKS